MNFPVATVGAPSSPSHHHETAASAAAAQAKAQVEARYTIALARPRDMDVVRERLLKDCQRPTFAETAEYRKPQGKRLNQETGQWEQQYVTGPSIRFAEAAIRCMGNMLVQEVTTYDDDEKRIIEISVTDLESNTAFPSSITIEKTVERKKARDGDDIIRKRTNTNGDPVFILRATEDELLNKKNALLSKAIRTNGLRLVPGDLIDECLYHARQTRKNEDARDPDAARLKIIDAFTSINVSVADLKKYIGDDLARLSPKDLDELRAIHAAIKDGETTWRAAMEAKHPSESLGERMKADLGAGQQQPTVATPKQDSPAAEKQATTKAPSIADLLAAFKRASQATKPESAHEAVDRVCGVPTPPDKVPAEKRAAVITALNDLAG